MIRSTGFPLHSPSKLNLFLEVLGKRDDGFHELETVMVRTNLCDTMYFAPSDSKKVELRLTDNAPASVRQSFPLDESNLILRAAEKLQQFANTGQGAVISINKRIPAEAGLAGGSGNAATTLKGLNRLWGLNLAKGQLHEIAGTLGSDINFFVEDCRAAVCTGRGEIVRPIQLTGQLHFVAARPLSGNSTPEVFRNLKRNAPNVGGRADVTVSGYNSEPRNSEAVEGILSGGRIDHLSSHIFNRLTESAVEINDEMAQLLTLLETVSNKRAFMSGSGSTCFVSVANAREACGLKSQLAAAISGLSFVADLQSL